jgi:hypothetical protein
VAIELAGTVGAIGQLGLRTQPIGHLGEAAASGSAFGAQVDGMRLQLVVDAAAAVAAPTA